MDDNTPPSASSSVGPTPDGYRIQKTPKTLRKRNRVPISCRPCRTRKLKCSKASPCDNCTKRGDEANCTYEAAASAAARRKSTSASGSAHGSHDELSARLHRLEGMLASFHSQVGGPVAGKKALSAASSNIGSGSLGSNIDGSLDFAMRTTEGRMGEEDVESETDGMTSSLGMMKVDPESRRVHYIGDGHWAAMLTEVANEVAEMRNYWATHRNEMYSHYEKIQQERKDTGSDAGCGPALLFGAGPVPPVKEILRPLPNKRTCEIFIARYFHTFDPSTHILHGPSFKRQFDQFWENPSSASIAWVGMLFAMMRLAMLSYVRSDDEPTEYKGKCQDMANTFRTQMTYCLISVDYTKAQPYVIETLIFHLQGEYSSSRDSESSVWVLSGMIVRLAMKMGYHRDSKNFPAISPFQGEMRRRIWTFIRSSDLLFSFQNALPPMIRLGESDTELPRNLRDEDFDENSVTLPPSRPADEDTPINYMIAKGKLVFGFGRVLEELNTSDRKSYENVLRIDKALRDIYNEIPDYLKVRSTNDQQDEAMTTITARYALAAVYHTAHCVLHRRFVRLAKPNNRYQYSRITCLGSAMQLLNYQAIHSSTSHARGSHRFIGSLITHDYLVACTLVCMDLRADQVSREKVDMSTPGSAPTPSSTSGGSNISASVSGDDKYCAGLPYTREDMLTALERSRDIWKSQENVSMEAYKAGGVLTQVLLKLRQPLSPPSRDISSPSSMFNGAVKASMNDERNAAMMLGMLQQGTNMNNNSSSPQSVQAAQAAEMAQQAQMQIPGVSDNMSWDRSTYTINGQSTIGSANNPIANLFNMNDASNMFDSGTNLWAQPMFGKNDPMVDNDMDWRTWDQNILYNLQSDPMASLWSDNSPENMNNMNISLGANNSGNYFSNSPPHLEPTTSINSNSDVNKQSSQSYKMDSTAFPNASTNGDMNHNLGRADAFMGAGTPGPGGVGIGTWKWTMADGGK